MKEIPLQERLTLLYALQELDTQLREIHDLKGDLPDIVATLEGRLDEAKAKSKQLKDTMKELKTQRDSADDEILTLNEKIEKYKGQQLQVKSNKQYDSLTKEIDYAVDTISKRQKEMDLFEGKMKLLKSDLEATQATIDELTGELDEKQKELREVSRDHEKEENKFKEQRKKMAEKIDKADLERYERIRKAKGGSAVVPVKRESCGGCFHRIPPQKILELRQNTRLFQCEHCGRILVSDEVVTLSTSLA